MSGGTIDQTDVSDPSADSAASLKGSVPVVPAGGRTRDRAIADTVLDGVTGAATAAHRFADVQVAGGLSLRDTVESLRAIAAADRTDAVADVEKVMRAQVATLSVMFTELTKRAACHLDGSPQMLDAYLRLAFRAQDQCRRTAETLATIGNPAAVVIAKNINNGSQVNIGALHQATLHAHDNDPSRRGNAIAIEQLDTGTAGTPVGSDPRLEAMDSVNRTADP